MIFYRKFGVKFKNIIKLQPKTVYQISIELFNFILARTTEIGQGVGRILSCEEKKKKKTWMDL